jgi:cobalamin biosynthesis protein CobT
MENNYFVSQQHKLNEQKKIIESFTMYLSTITKAMENGEYNFKMINDICTIIQDYYSNNDETLEENDDEEDEEDEEEDTSEKKEDTSENKEDDDTEKNSINNEESSDESEEAPKLEFVPEKKNMNLDLYEEFINSNYDIKKMLCKPNYDVEKNINTFISNSCKY